ncbi:PAS domain-containing sensor histidine kinase [Noviherbaspirillum denitrificans]|uniref:histidine kinase n=2 Tax=Noviherbaspirillum denitrificans TaxID=1968433 RepID=A0A254TC31_9BURK|nr:ATP-binding protein [Noviherbaspirillum denitrificans]OWW20190.1 PAS domain-containing sensor histidine kinase [Noviherbaspirillum denitrificans]
MPDHAALDGVDEATWVDVIQKMDEVYSQLVRDEIALEEKNEQLERSQQFIFSLLSAMSDVLVACNHLGDIEETNTALRELVGVDEQRLRGMTIYDLLADGTSAARVRRMIEQALPGGEVAELQLVHPTHGGVHVDFNCTPRMDSSGKRAGYVFVGRPLGELKRAYQELRQTHEALKRTQQQLLHAEKMASLGRLVAGVAHELNNPISFVLGNVHALKRYSDRITAYVEAVHEGDTPEQLAEMRQKLRIDRILDDLPSLIEGTIEGAQRTTDIVNGLKRFSAVDRDEKEQVDLNDVVERAIHWVSKGTAPHFAVHWERGAPLSVTGSAGKLLQVLMNVIQNAYDAASGAQVAQPALWITAGREDGKVALYLRDNGPGIPDACMNQIFDPFFTTKPVGKGTGLGLSISYGIVEKHGGTLSARNAPGGGAEFVIELPAA